MSLVCHVVWFSVPKGGDVALPDLLRRLNSLGDLVPQVRHLWAGAAVAPGDFDAGLVVVFDNMSDLEAYTVHPEHIPIAAELRSSASRIEVLDFEMADA